MPTCPRCSKSVYAAEQVTGPNSTMWHKSCLTCKECRRRLDSTNLAEKSGEAYCRACYGKLFGPKGYGFGGGSAFLSSDDLKLANATDSNIVDPSTIVASQNEAPPPELTPKSSGSPPPAQQQRTPTTSARTSPPAAQKWGSPNSARVQLGGARDTCPRCQKAVYFAEQALGPNGSKFHKLCFRCSECNKGLDSTNLADRTDSNGVVQVYCRSCHGKKFGPKGVGFGLGAGVLTTDGAA
ncbi:hypothetical protein BJ742DRAFT_838810 [Cladochytrium replicatum]|nr:hypothetical protein BJ742DRAFT_838810 [Cladochytrium replicatum]